MMHIEESSVRDSSFRVAEEVGKMAGHEATLSMVENSDGGLPAITGSHPMTFITMDVDGWSVHQFEKAGIEIKVFKVAPYSIYGSHAVPFECMCLIAEGSGELFLTDEGGRELSTLMCRKGDAFLQGENTRHGFRNGPDETMLIYLRVANSMGERTS
jgi:hypothetical protein